MGLLERIIATKREELSTLTSLRLPAPPQRRPVQLNRTPTEPLRLIAEIKRRSPSAGNLSTRLGVAERAQKYARAGASMLSVLCDRTYFDGSFEHLQQARAACDLPILCKEFVIHERQLEVARAYGADSALLIVRCLTPEQLKSLIAKAHAIDLLPFVEVANFEEAELALQAGASLIGVNARDLDTLAIDLQQASRVLASLPSSVTRVHLSGVSSAEAVCGIRGSSADAALVGEVLMRQDDPSELLATLIEAADSSP